MPARKPASLVTRKDAKAAKSKRKAAESALQPKRNLPAKPPGALTGHKAAGALWKKMIGLYSELDAQIVSLLDQDMLTDYCLLVEQLLEMDQLRKDSMKSWKRAETAIGRKKLSEVNVKELIQLQNALNGAFDEIVKLDARVDRKRSLLLSLRQSLYLTPRSRAGVVPDEKPPEPKKSKMAELLDNV